MLLTPLFEPDPFVRALLLTPLFEPAADPCGRSSWIARDANRGPDHHGLLGARPVAFSSASIGTRGDPYPELSPGRASRTRTTPSAPAVANRLPSGLKATA